MQCQSTTRVIKTLVLLCVISLTVSCPVGCTCGVSGAPGFDEYSVACEGSDLQAIPSGIPSQTTDLSLSHNRLTRLFPEDFEHLDEIRVLYLRGNIFGRIFNETFVTLQKMKNLIGIDLSGNPWDCTCTAVMYEFVRWLEQHRGPQPTTNEKQWLAIIDGYDTLCATPPVLNSKRLDELVPADIC